MISILPKHFKHTLETSNNSPFLFYYTQHVGKVVFNRPSALNSVNLEMFKLYRPEVERWNQQQNPKVLIFSGNGGKAFSAGGDLKYFYEARKRSVIEMYDYFRELFTLFYLSSTIKPIQIALWDGIVIGAGAGLTLKAPIKIATENTIFAMPEAKIGLFLGIGGGHYFSRMKNHVGYYIGLAAASLQGKEVLQCGIADFYVKREKLAQLELEIFEKTNENTNVEDLRELVRKYAEPVEGEFVHAEFINRVFGKGSVEGIFNELELLSKEGNSFAGEILKTMKGLPPFALKVIYEEIKRGENMSLRESLIEDFRMCYNLKDSKDFDEGLHCMLIEKRKPVWEHKSVSEVKTEEVLKIFEKIPKEFELVLPEN